MPLSPRQRQYLKGLAHSLEPVVRVGKGRISDEVVAETARSIEAHEVIKVRIETDDSKLRRELASSLAERAEADLVGSIGKIAILYKPRKEKPAIKLPA